MPTFTDLQRSLDTTSPTLRRWSQDFSDYLSADANPGKGITRRYNNDDARVLALVAAMRQDNQTIEAIHAALAAGDRGQWPIDEPVEQPEPAGDDQTFALVTQLTAAASQWEAIATTVTDERDNLRESLEAERDARLAAEIRATAAETELNVLKDKKGFWQRLFGS